MLVNTLYLQVNAQAYQKFVKTPQILTTDVGLPVTIISNDVCASAKQGRR